ncbi:hypothetical protein [Methanobacterium sp. ACI-7]|uniref:hypothetical protein n=1 Tax=unclassified Methanobacterium TaxID=2627676 RepID=UPI0039C4AAB8
MQTITIISLILLVGAALAVPIFADEITEVFNGNNSSNFTNSSLNINGNNSSISDNSTLNNTNSTTNSTLTLQQLQTLTDTQNKLTALIATIGSIKATYGSNAKAKGLLNALDQFEKQANRLNAEISAFIQNPSVNSTEGADGIINSFVKREAALEHKVSIKQSLLAKMGSKTTEIKKATKVSKNTPKQKKNKK